MRETDALAATDPDAAADRLRTAGLDAWASDNLLAYLREQRDATGRVPDDRTVVVERFRDELGDWRVVVHSPYGAKVHAPWALVLAARLRERYGVDAAAMHADDGIVLRLPDTGDSWLEGATDGSGGLGGDAPVVGVEDLLLDPDDVLDAVRDELGGSVMFASRFREAAARALLLPRRRPDRRQPLWQQRQRSAQLLSVASEYPEFPIVLEAARECLQDDFDVAALTDLMRDLAAGRVRLVEVTTPTPSPFAQSLLFGYTAQFLYDGDAPLAERRAAALSLDPTLLAELLGGDGVAAQLADLLDPAQIERTEAELGALAPERQARHAEDVWDVLRRLGPLTEAEVAARTREDVRADVAAWLRELKAARRIMPVRLAGSRPSARSSGRSWRTPAACATRSASRCPSASPRCSRSPSPTRWATSCAATRARTARSPPPTSPHASGWASPSSCRRSSGSRRPGSSCAAGCGPRRSAARATTGATPRCCASCAVARSPRCAPRWSPSPPRRWACSSRAGKASGLCAASTGCCASSSSSPARPSPRRRSRPSCSQRA